MSGLVYACSFFPIILGLVYVRLFFPIISGRMYARPFTITRLVIALYRGRALLAVALIRGRALPLSNWSNRVFRVQVFCCDVCGPRFCLYIAKLAIGSHINLSLRLYILDRTLG